VIVPVRNEAKFIAATLTQLLEQDYDPGCFEVIVADGDSTDETPELVRAMQDRYPNLYLVPNPGRWSSAGRNAALEVSRGDIVVVVDGHCDVDTASYLTSLVDAFERSGAACVGRPQPLDVSRATPLQKAVAACRASRLGHHPDSFIYSSEERRVKASSVAVAYRREVFETLGTFDERFDACEDVEFNHRIDAAGYDCFFCPRVRVRYHPRGTLAGLFRQMVRYGRGRVRLLRKHEGTFTLPGFVPALFVLGVLLGPLVGMLSPWLMATYLGCLAFYSSLVVLTSVVIGLKARDVRQLVLPLLVFPAIHAGAGSGILLELLRPGRQPGDVLSMRQRQTEATRRAA
jgi:succinoglycan biosynthesis protein ExoA